MDCSPPGSSVHGIFQARILELVAIFSSKWSSRPVLHLLHWQADFFFSSLFNHWATWAAQLKLQYLLIKMCKVFVFAFFLFFFGQGRTLRAFQRALGEEHLYWPLFVRKAHRWRSTGGRWKHAHLVHFLWMQKLVLSSPESPKPSPKLLGQFSESKWCESPYKNAH